MIFAQLSNGGWASSWKPLVGHESINAGHCSIAASAHRSTEALSCLLQPFFFRAIHSAPFSTLTSTSGSYDEQREHSHRFSCSQLIVCIVVFSTKKSKRQLRFCTFSLAVFPPVCPSLANPNPRCSSSLPKDFFTRPPHLSVICILKRADC